MHDLYLGIMIFQDPIKGPIYAVFAFCFFILNVAKTITENSRITQPLEKEKKIVAARSITVSPNSFVFRSSRERISPESDWNYRVSLLIQEKSLK